MTFHIGPYETFDYKATAIPAGIVGMLKDRYRENELRWAYLGGVCPQCKKPVVAMALCGRNEMSQITASLGDMNRICTPHLEKVEIYPNPVEYYSHTSIPEELRESVLAIQKMRDDSYPSHIIIATCRTILENAVTALGETSGEVLFKKIDNLRKNGRITQDLADWAHIIRNDGNKAVHSMSGTNEEANEMVEFTLIFLQYVFELPARIREKKIKD